MLKNTGDFTAGKVGAHPELAAELRPFLAVRGRPRRAHAVGTGGAGSDGLCRHRRPTSASRPLHACRGTAVVRVVWHIAPPGGRGHLGIGALLASSVAEALVAAGAASDAETYQAYAAAFVLLTGLIFLAAGLAKLGFITQFLSKPVMAASC